jgi:hypothetical protein
VFDLRYHVASLAAVFLALIIGILVGAGLAARTDVEGSERAVLREQIDDLEQRNGDLSQEADLLRRQQVAGDTYVQKTYDVVMDGRLRAVNVALLFVGPSNDGDRDSLEQTLEDASGPGLIEMEALDLPVDPQEVRNALDPQFRDLGLEEVGRRLAGELIAGGDTPFWDALTPVLVQDRSGTSTAEADAVAISQTAVATDAPTRLFVDGIYSGLARAGVPVVAIERTDARPSRIPTYQSRGISSVDSVDTQLGRVALAALLAGGQEGHYGVKQTAKDGPLPPVESLPLAPLPGG